MKKSITSAVMLLAGACVAWSQGTVSMGNYLGLTHYIYASYGYPGFGPVRLGGTSGNATGNPAADVGKGNDWTVALYGLAGINDSPQYLAECTTAGGGFATATFATGPGNDNVPGTWGSGTVAQIPGTTLAGQTATLQLRVWYNDGGTITSSGGFPSGASAIVNLLSTGGPNNSGPPTLPPPLPAGFGNILIERLSPPPGPEPSALALGIVGGCAILLRQRCGKRN